jgi:HPt (histidine-containing phosphotransfer) domain-containing protein
LLRAIKEQFTIGSLPTRTENIWQKSITSTLSLKLAGMVPAYLQNCRLSVVTILEALDRVDFETVSRLGHNMRGSGGAYGFQGITDICADLQAAADKSDEAASRKCVKELAKCLDHAQAIVN